MRLSTIFKEYKIKWDKVKMIRHPLSKQDVKMIYEMGFIEAYQAEQGKPVFDGCEYILSFLGTSNTNAMFIGCYKVGMRYEEDVKKDMMPFGFPFPEYFDRGCYYELELTDIMGELRNRLVIDWGKSTIGWHQWTRVEKEVIAIYSPKNIREIKEFKSYEDTILTFHELETIINDPLTYEDWYSALYNINGIYLIRDEETGKQYVGSTYNIDGIYGRWKCYADTHHGGDVGIIAELNSRPNAYEKFVFTILRVLPKIITPEEAINIESLYKQKLGTRIFGMNNN